jgi:hypothetical protein
MALDPSAFVDQLTDELILQAPEEVQVSAVASPVLREQLIALQQDVREGLEDVLRGGPIDGLHDRLKARKSELVAKAPAHNFTLERLVARAIESTMKAAREELETRRARDTEDKDG